MKRKPEPFAVKHYADTERPIFKGNGFDGIEIADTREEAESLAAFVNQLIEERAELLAHLQIVAFHLRRDDFRSGSPSLRNEALDRIEAIIAKATGETK